MRTLHLCFWWDKSVRNLLVRLMWHCTSHFRVPIGRSAIRHFALTWQPVKITQKTRFCYMRNQNSNWPMEGSSWGSGMENEWQSIHRRNPTAVRHRCAQRCDSDGADTNVTALTVTALGHQWLWHRCNSDVYISVTAMATDTAVTAMTTDTAVTAMFTLVWQRWQLTVLWQRWKLPTALSAVTAVAADSDVYISVTAPSVATTFTVMCTSLSH